MTRRRLVRIFCGLSLAAALWAAIAALSAGVETHIAGIPISSRSPARPLLLAAAAGLIAWALTLARTPEELRQARPTPAWASVSLLVLMVVALNLLLLVQPPPPPPPFNGCFFDYPIGRGFRHFLNCDSPEYLGLAKNPSLVWTHGILQGRPLSFGLPWALAQLLRLVPFLETSGPYIPYAREFTAYVLINLFALTTALVCFARLLASGMGSRPGIELLFSMVVLAANDVTKLFFWTPHTQVFILLVPCFTMYLSFKLLTRGRRLRATQALLAGLGLGLGALLYGAFLIPALCIAAIHVIVFRRVWPAVLVCVAALLPYVTWAAFVYSQLGSFYNHEASMYRHFLWMADCAKVSLASCVPATRDNMLTLFNMAAPILVVPAVLAVLLRLARYVWPGEGHPVPSPTLGRAVVFTLGSITLFLVLMGRYAPRLCWFLVPPILLMVALEFQAFRLSHPRARLRGLNVSIAIGCIVYVALLAARQGPYQ